MKISYAVLACVESVELQQLLPFLKEHKGEDDEPKRLVEIRG